MLVVVPENSLNNAFTAACVTNDIMYPRNPHHYIQIAQILAKRNIIVPILYHDSTVMFRDDEVSFIKGEFNKKKIRYHESTGGRIIATEIICEEATIVLDGHFEFNKIRKRFHLERWGRKVHIGPIQTPIEEYLCL